MSAVRARRQRLAGAVECKVAVISELKISETVWLGLCTVWLGLPELCTVLLGLVRVAEASWGNCSFVLSYSSGDSSVYTHVHTHTHIHEKYFYCYLFYLAVLCYVDVIINLNRRRERRKELYRRVVQNLKLLRVTTILILYLQIPYLFLEFCSTSEIQAVTFFFRKNKVYRRKGNPIQVYNVAF